MRPLLDGPYANPSATHTGGRSARALLERARAQVGDLLGCGSDEIVFTSGGSEADNLALTGVFFALRERGEHIVTTAVEHPAILEPARFLERLGARVTVVPSIGPGCVDPEDVRRAITPRRSSSSVMQANNEVGTIQPIAAIAEIARRRASLVHTDAAQSVGKIPTRVDELGVDLLTIAGHKVARGDPTVDSRSAHLHGQARSSCRERDQMTEPHQPHDHDHDEPHGHDHPHDHAPRRVGCDASSGPSSGTATTRATRSTMP